MSLSIDASEVVHLLRNPQRSTQAILDRMLLGGVDLVITSPVRHELISGALASAAPERRLAQLEELLVQFTQADFTPEDATASGSLRARLRRKGKPIGDIDTLIAGQALARGWMVVTRNVRHFGQVEGLDIIDWSVSEAPLTPSEIAARL